MVSWDGDRDDLLVGFADMARPPPPTIFIFGDNEIRRLAAMFF